MKRTEAQIWKPFFHLLRNSHIPWNWYIANFLLGFVISMITVRLPQLTGEILQGEIFDKGLIGTYLSVTLFSMIISFFSSTLGTWIRLNTDKNLQKTLWNHVLYLPLKIYENLEPSSFITRVTQDTSGVSQGISSCLGILTNTWTIFLMLKSIYKINTGMVFAMISVIPWIIIVAFVTGRYSFRASNRMQQSLSSFTTIIAERLANIKGIKINGEERVEWEKGKNAAQKQYEAEIYRAKVNLFSQPFIYASEAFLKALVLIYGGLLISQNKLESGEFITIYMYMEMLPIYTIQYIFAHQTIKEVHGATIRAGEILLEPNEQLNLGNHLTAINQDIIFEHVSFAYDQKPVLLHADFRIPAGKTTAIVGASGSGKTTVLNLLGRFYTPTEGKILFQGKDINSIRLADWREKLCYVPQNVSLLSGTIWENLTYGWKKKNDIKCVEQAAKYANAYEFITKLPDQFKTEVGEKGCRFSSGECQRLALARALVKDPEFLLLDEATCNLDAYHAAKVQTSIKNLMKMKTCIIVVHNMEIACNADHIIVLNHGKVCGEGSHQQLYKTCDTYRQLFDTQLENRKSLIPKEVAICENM